MLHAHNLVLCVDIENTLKILKILMPHAHNLALCVDIENTLKILTPHAHNLVLCVDIKNTLKKLKNTHATRPQAGTVCSY